MHGVLLTSGDAGSMSIPREDLALVREDEAKAAGDVLGLTSLTFLRRPDASFAAFDDAMFAQAVTLLRTLKPQIVFTHHQDDDHQDHKLLHQMVGRAVGMAGGPWLQESEGNPHHVAEVYAYEVWAPMTQFQAVVDVTATMPKKLQALQCHASQIKDIAYQDAAEGLARYRAVMGLGSGKFAEVFKILKGGKTLQELS